MLIYPNINPVAFHVGSWPVYWYGLMYLVGFMLGWSALSLRLKFSPRNFTSDQLSDVIFFTALGAILGGRLGYMFFYSWSDWISNPLLVFQTWKGGMSFHGGAFGVIIAMIFCANKIKKSPIELLDLITPVVPIGLGAGRIGNFINGELWGRVTDVPWGMVFPSVDAYPRHPSQLYEFALEGVLLFVILWLFSRKIRSPGAVAGVFAICYALFRFSVEFYREPDLQMGYFAGWLTAGQLLSFPLVLIGLWLIAHALKHRTAQRALQTSNVE